MREIKYRFVYQGEHRIHYKWYYIENFIDRSLSKLSDYHHQMKLIAIEQCTGLKDKNGKEIYEGDILDFDENEWGGKFKPEVITFDKIIGNWELCGTVGDVEQWRKIIGNIHENQELLK
jgi:uncharacterized phage protein (TIGR01671 family)